MLPQGNRSSSWSVTRDLWAEINIKWKEHLICNAHLTQLTRGTTSASMSIWRHLKPYRQAFSTSCFFFAPFTCPRCRERLDIGGAYVCGGSLGWFPLDVVGYEGHLGKRCTADDQAHWRLPCCRRPAVYSRETALTSQQCRLRSLLRFVAASSSVCFRPVPILSFLTGGQTNNCPTAFVARPACWRMRIHVEPNENRRWWISGLKYKLTENIHLLWCVPNGPSSS